MPTRWEAWTALEEFPLNGWYRHTLAWWRLQGTWTGRNDDGWIQIARWIHAAPEIPETPVSRAVPAQIACVVLDGMPWTPEEMLQHWEWTPDPRVPRPRPCGKQVIG